MGHVHSIREVGGRHQESLELDEAVEGLIGCRRRRGRGRRKQEFDLHIHQSREKGQISEVDDCGILGYRRRSDPSDALSLDQQVARRHQLALVEVEHSSAA
jgi:hypothetical protein